MGYATPSGTGHQDETVTVIAASKVNGTKVCNDAGEPLGSIHDLMIDKRSGIVAYAVMSFGGFLGIGEKYHPVPWEQLTYSETYDSYVVDLDKRVLENAPSYSSSDFPDWSSPAYRSGIDEYYGSRETSREPRERH
jgi:sporulation protein YlmC with PRC-barrel domain